MSAVIAVLVVLAAALAAGLSTQINQSSPNYATEEPTNVAQSDEICLLTNLSRSTATGRPTSI
jgi:hypothetical protein